MLKMSFLALPNRYLIEFQFQFSIVVELAPAEEMTMENLDVLFWKIKLSALTFQYWSILKKVLIC